MFPGNKGEIMSELKKVLMSRDKMTSKQADERISQAADDLMQRLGEGEDCYDFCSEEFGLEPDYLMDLV